MSISQVVRPKAETNKWRTNKRVTDKAKTDGERGILCRKWQSNEWVTVNILLIHMCYRLVALQREPSFFIFILRWSVKVVNIIMCYKLPNIFVRSLLYQEHLLSHHFENVARKKKGKKMKTTRYMGVYVLAARVKPSSVFW